MARRKKYIPKSFESKGYANGKYVDDHDNLRKDTSAAIWESMIISPVFKNLKTRQKYLYVICKSQLYGKTKPSADFPDDERFKSELCFYLPFSAVVEYYGLYTRNGKKEFSADMKMLESRGFIKKIYEGGFPNKKSIYKFTSDWQNWKADS